MPNINDSALDADLPSDSEILLQEAEAVVIEAVKVQEEAEAYAAELLRTLFFDAENDERSSGENLRPDEEETPLDEGIASDSFSSEAEEAAGTALCVEEEAGALAIQAERAEVGEDESLAAGDEPEAPSPELASEPESGTLTAPEAAGKEMPDGPAASPKPSSKPQDIRRSSGKGRRGRS